MKTLPELKAQEILLRRDLQTIETELTEARTLLQRAISDTKLEAGAAGAMAGRVTILEARKAALLSALEQKADEIKHADDILNSREHKAEQKKITELESFFASEARAIHADQAKLHARILAAFEQYSELHRLIEKSPSIAQSEKFSRERNADYLYLCDVFQPLEAQAKREAMREHLKQPASKGDNPSAKKTVKPSLYFMPNGEPVGV